MTHKFTVPWGAWYLDTDLSLEFPDSWQIKKFDIKNPKAVKSIDKIKEKLNNPIGTPSLENISKNKENAVIVVDDISRPTKAENILEVVLDKLNQSGISDENVDIIFAIGAHRPMNRFDFEKKVGKKILERINIENHHPYENLKFIGTSNKGTPIHINKTYYNADVKISIGAVLPHPLAGFGGGAKVILPGICGIDTLEANHKAGVRGIGIGLGIVTELRKDIENACQKIGLDFSINIIPNMEREIAGIFSGDFIKAHRKAMEFAKKVYSLSLSSNLKLDIGFFNLYPEDTEFSQALKGLNLLLSSGRLIKRKGAVVLMTASSEGRGFHSLQGETGGRLYQNWGDSIIFKGILRKNTFGIFSPNIDWTDVKHYYPDRTIFKKNFNEMIGALEDLYGRRINVGIFPCSNLLP